MKMSDTIGEIATALSAAQGEIQDAMKGSLNPHFKSKYADLAAIRTVIREPLSKHGLSIVQLPRAHSSHVEVETIIMHKSGEFISETLNMPVSKQDAHGIGSAITYARRYGMSAVLCIATDDDDGNAAVEKNAPRVVRQRSDAEAEELYNAARHAANEGSDKLRSFWSELSGEKRSLLTADKIQSLKEIASEADKNESE